MTHEEFLKWLDEEIEKSWKENDIEARKIEPDGTPYGRANALEEVKEKFLIFTPTNNTQ